MRKYIDKAAVLIEALPYIQRFRGDTVVVKFGGSAMEDPDCVASTLRDIVFMECVGMKPVIVHGGGKAISTRLGQLGIASRFINGMRYTCKDTIGVVDDVLHSDVNEKLVDGVRKLGGRARDLSGKKILGARRLSHTDEAGAPVDLGFVGDVVSVDVGPICELLAANELPVITPVGLDDQQRPFNINADLCACRVAQALQAAKLVFLSDVPGLLADPKNPDSLISTLHTKEIAQLVADGVISGGMAPKIASASAAISAGVRKVHLIDGRLQHSLLLEIFTDHGVGTQIIGT
ncbi:MAG TPA: acetylglutamate kinase [Lentisphaeria bacterium]|nr:acetylglutamate kinase [Lentisphaeria bacterium]